MIEHRVAATADVRDGTAIVVDVGDRHIALFRLGDAFYAIDETCPHRGAPLSRGEVRDGIVVCPWHEWQFALTTGCSPVNPASRVRRYDVRVENDAVWITVPPRD